MYGGNRRHSLGEWVVQFYIDPDRESDPHALPDAEVFQLTAREAAELDEDMVSEYQGRPEFRLAGMNSATREAMFDAMIAEEGVTGGWFWWSCFPGCLPDGAPDGPYATRAEAIAAAREA